MTGHLLNISISFLIAAVFVLVGGMITQRLKLQLSFLEEMVVSFGLGLGVVAYGIFALGLAGFLYKQLVLVLFLAIIIYRLNYAGYAANRFMELLKALKPRRLGAASTLLICVVIIQLMINFLYNLGPVTGWDAPQHYLYLARIYTQEHGIRYLPSHILAGGPQLIEMIFTLAYMLYDGVTAVMMNWWIAFAMALTTYCFSRRYLGRALSLGAAAIVLCIPGIIYHIGEGKPTLGTHFLGILSLFLFIRYRDRHEIAYLILSAVFGALAMAGSPMSAFFVMAIVISNIVLELPNRRNLKKEIALSALFAAIVVCIGAPFYIRNAVLTGNPLFPFCYNLFGGKNGNPILYEYLKELYPARLLNPLSFLGFLRDYVLTFSPQNFYGRPTSPLFLILIPMLVFIRNWPRVIKTVAVVSLFYFIALYFFSGPQRRYALAIVPFLSLLSMYAVSVLNGAGRMFRYINYILVGSFLAYGMLFALRSFSPRADVVFMKEAPDSYLSRNYDYYETLKFANRSLPGESRVLLVFVHGYYCDLDSLRGDYAQGLIAYDLLYTPGKIVSRLKELGVDYVIMSNNLRMEGGRWFDMPYARLDMIRDRYLQEIFSKNNVLVYKVNYGNFKG